MGFLLKGKSEVASRKKNISDWHPSQASSTPSGWVYGFFFLFETMTPTNNHIKSWSIFGCPQKKPKDWFLPIQGTWDEICHLPLTHQIRPRVLCPSSISTQNHADGETTYPTSSATLRHKLGHLSENPAKKLSSLGLIHHINKPPVTYESYIWLN